MEVHLYESEPVFYFFCLKRFSFSEQSLEATKFRQIAGSG